MFLILSLWFKLLLRCETQRQDYKYSAVCLSGSALAASVCKKITGRLTSAIAKQEDVSVQLEALDIMADMLCRYLPAPEANANQTWRLLLRCLRQECVYKNVLTNGGVALC